MSVESSAPQGAVFLSYASQDKAAALRICETLRAAGVEVWFDQDELVGGDQWDAKIRGQISSCALFLPVISANTQARLEGYFRLEWKLAAQRTYTMADEKAFLLPVLVDGTRDADAKVPAEFKSVQWTKLPGGETPPAFVARVKKLLAGDVGRDLRIPPAGAQSAGSGDPALQKRSRPKWIGFAIVGAIVGLLFALAPVFRRPAGSPATPAAPVIAAPVAIKPALPAVSEARKLAEKGRELFDKLDSNAEDFAVAETLIKRALELDATDGVIWAYSARLNAGFLTRSFERGNARAETARNHAERAVKLAPDSAEAWHALGRAIWRSDPPRAEEALRHALQLAPEDGRILLSNGSILRNQSRDDEALAFYVRAAAQPDVRPLALYDQFLMHLYQRRFAEADRCVREAVAALPSTNSVTGLAILDVVWHGDVDGARRTLDAAPVGSRSEPRMVFASALAALMAKQSDEALRALDRLPGDFINDAWYSGPKALFIGLAHAQAGRPEAARNAWEAGITLLRRRLQDTPNDAELHLRLGELLGWTGEVELALREARLVEELTRNRSDWTFSSARIYAALGRADAAVPILEKFLTAAGSGRWPFTTALMRLDPIWGKIRDDVGFQRLVIQNTPPRNWPLHPELKKVSTLIDGIQVIPEDIRLAEEITERVLNANPTDPEAVTIMARVHSMWLLRGWDRSTARYQKAKAMAERALQLAPDEPEAHVALAIHLYARGADAQRAVDLAQRAVDLSPQEARFHRMRDNCLWVVSVPTGSVFTESTLGPENPGLRRALESARRTVELFPQDPLVRYELSRHYRDIGRWADFERVNDEVLALAPLANAMVWKARARFGLHGDLPGMKATLDQVPARVRVIERTVFGYFIYAAFTGNTQDGLDALNSMTESWMIDFDYRGPKALLTASLLELAGKKELARVQYEAALAELLKARPLNPDDSLTYLNEAWILHGLGRDEAALAALRIYNETLPHPYLLSPLGTWWFQAITANLLIGNRPQALTLMREVCAALPEGRKTIQSRISLDPRLAAFRNDPEIQALLAEPASATPNTQR